MNRDLHSKTGIAKSTIKSIYERHAVARSHTEAVLSNILYGSNTYVNSNSSLLLHSLACLTSGMRIITFKQGFSIGRELYRMLSEKRHYAVYEESIPELVSFLERAGIGKVAYAAFDDRLVLGIYGGERRYVGANIHVFEAGIIAGFVSSGRHEYSIVEEKACMNNNADHCEFAFYARIRQRKEPESENMAGGKELLDTIMKHIYKPQKNYEDISSSYMALLSNTIADHRYIEEMKGIMAYMGSGIGDIIAKRSTSRRFDDMLDVLKGIYTGMVSEADKEPVKIVMNFDGTMLSKEYAELSLSLLNGILPKIYRSRRMKAIEINRYNLYKIKIAEEK